MNFAQFTLFALLSALSFEAITAVDYSYSYKDPETSYSYKDPGTSYPSLSLTNEETECGNGVCDSDEDCKSCPLDCISHSPVCGDGICESGENCDNCDEDCNGELVDSTLGGGLFCCFGGDEEPQGLPNAVSCNDSRCDTVKWNCNPKPAYYCCGDGTCDGKEKLANCAIDDCKCGNDVCDDGEDTDSCPEDCTCNDNGICDTWETVKACPLDCTCGNYKCEPEFDEHVSTCEHDCGCNRNYKCEEHEDFEHCPEDCEDPGEDISGTTTEELSVESTDAEMGM